jgi:hypothetical protein
MREGRAERRRAIAAAARRVLDDPHAYAAFEALVTEDDWYDPQLEELLDQITHLPPRSQLFGSGREAREEHWAYLRRLIAAAEV